MAKKVIEAIIYARQSSGSDDQSDSVDTQIENCKKLCASRGYFVLAVCRDLNTSGRTYPLGGRALAENDQAFQEWYNQQSRSRKYRAGLDMALTMLAPTRVLVVDDLTRIYRGLKNSYLGNYIKQQLLAAHAQVETVKSGVFDPMSFDDELIETVQSHVNDQQIQIGKLKSIEVRRRLRDEGILACSARALGLIYLGKHQYQIDDRYREAIRYLYNQVVANVTYSQITREMNEKYKDLFSKHFYESNFYHMASQPLYAGYMRNSLNEVIQCQGLVGEPAISYELWLKVQEMMEKKRRTPLRGVRGDRVLIFSRKMVCGYCGSSMVVIRDDESVAYFCKGGVNLERNKDCVSARARISETKSKFYTGLQHALAPLLVLAQYQLCLEESGYAQYRNKYQAIKEKLLGMRERLNNLTQYYMNGETDKEVFECAQRKANADMRKMETELCELQEHLATDYKQKKLNDPFWGNFFDIMENRLPDGKYKELFDRVVDKIVCFKDYVTVCTRFGNFNLDRYVAAKGRSFPIYTWEIKQDDNEVPKDITKCKLEVTYLYADNRKKKVKIDFPVLKISEASI